MIALLIYLIGYAVAFMALILEEHQDEDITVKSLFIIAVLSLFSWLGILVFLAVLFCVYVVKKELHHKVIWRKKP